MTIVMFHSGKALPEYLKYTFRQLRLFNPKVDVYFITDHQWMYDPLFEMYNIRTIDKRDYASEDITTFEVLYGRGTLDFWTITTTRLFYIANFIEERHLHNVYHFENDILLYADLSELHFTFSDIYPHMGITYGGPDKAMTGMLYIHRPKALTDMIKYMISLLRQNSLHGIRKMFDVDMVNEMTLMRIYSKENPDKLSALPILPFGDWSRWCLEFNSIFDPASWGQFVGGTTDGIPGAKPEDHYIGQMLRQHNDYTVVWRETDKGRVPYFRYDTQEVKINNLHIHSKQLHKYVS